MAKERPNILHLFTDMQRWDTLGCAGNPLVKTPNLDRLASDGVVFTNAFSPSPVCISARCSMIHGQYPMHTGCYENTRMPTDGRETVMAALARAGYRTHGIGKCHFAPDAYALRGFRDREIQEEGGAPMERLADNHYLKYLYDRGHRHICEAFGVRGEMYYVPQPSQLPARDHPTQWVGDRAVAFLEQAGTSGEPWYLYASFVHPHPPFTPPNPWHKLYRPSLMPFPNVPEDSASLQTLANRIQNRYKYRDQGVDRNLVRLIRAYYLACVSFIDMQVGRIVAQLERAGLLDRTLIVFTSDHGEYLGDYNCWGKRSMHDASARVPMIARLPGVFAGGARCEAPVSLVDIAPTFASAAGAELGTHALDGKDLAEVAAGTATREAVFSQISLEGPFFSGFCRDTDTSGRSWTPEERRARYSTCMAVSRAWKYFYSAPDEAEFLFDRMGDSRETRNRKGVTFCRPALDEMRERLWAHLRGGGETAGLTGSGWKRFPRVELDPDPDSGLLIQDLYTPWADMRIPGYGG